MIPNYLKTNERLKWEDCRDKLAPIHGNEKKLKLIFQWAKQPKFPFIVFRALIETEIK